MKRSTSKPGAWRPGRRQGTKRRKAVAARSTEYNLLLTATLVLLALGAVMVFSASSTTQVLSNGGLSTSFAFLKKTLIIGTVGLVLMFLVIRGGLGSIRKLTPAILIASFGLLCVVLVAGVPVNGATRWMGSGYIQIQPSELAKVALILYGCDILARKPEMTRSISGMMPYLLVVGAACCLVMLQPDLGTVMVTVFAVAATLVAAGARLRDLAIIAGVIGFLVLLMIMVEPYRMERLTTFLHPNADPFDAGRQAIQAKIALGSGGLSGVGIGDGVQKAFYLPEAHTDMIAAVIGEELGFVGIIGIIGCFGLFGFAGLRIAQQARDHYGKLLAAGLTTLILVQALINLYAVMGLAPLTGVPLPFVSYGNNSLIVSLLAVGMILNIARGGTAPAPVRDPARVSRSRGAGRSRSTAKPRRTRPVGRPALRPGIAQVGSAGRLRVVNGGRSEEPGRSESASAESRDSRGRDSRARGTGDGRGRRASR